VAIPLASMGWNVVGVDIDRQALNEATKKAHQKHVSERCTFVCCDAVDFIATTKEVFDIVICAEVLEHLSSPSKLLAGCYRVLVDNGILIVTVPNGLGLTEFLIIKPARIFRNILGLSSKIGEVHQQSFRVGQIRRMLHLKFEIQYFKCISNLSSFLPFLVRNRYALWAVRIMTYIPVHAGNGWLIVARKKEHYT